MFLLLLYQFIMHISSPIPFDIMGDTASFCFCCRFCLCLCCSFVDVSVVVSDNVAVTVFFQHKRASGMRLYPCDIARLLLMTDRGRTRCLMSAFIFRFPQVNGDMFITYIGSRGYPATTRTDFCSLTTRPSKGGKWDLPKWEALEKAVNRKEKGSFSVEFVSLWSSPAARSSVR